ncbi:hypothetical protein UlMin_031576 [Ulmus minor]
MFSAMSNSTSLSEEASISSGSRLQDFGGFNALISTIPPQQPEKIKKKRSLPGNPDPDAEVIALSPKTLMATNRFVCEICNKGFQRDQNLQLHRRGHNLPWKLKQRNGKEIKKRAYVCPEPSCVHHHPSRALGDLTGIKKHFCRKHGEKKWKCEKCSKIYAVQSDWKAHSKTCGTREYRCDCGTLFSRKDSFITHRAFCDALAEESARISANQFPSINTLFPFPASQNFTSPNPPPIHIWDPPRNPNPNPTPQNNNLQIKPEAHHFQIPPFLQVHETTTTTATPPKGLITSPFHTSNAAASPHLSATALLQKAATFGAVTQQSQPVAHMAGLAMSEFGRSAASRVSTEFLGGLTSGDLATWQKTDRMTRDFLGLTGDANGGDGLGNGAVNVKNVLTYAGAGIEFPDYERDHSMLKNQGFGFAETWADC